MKQINDLQFHVVLTRYNENLDWAIPLLPRVTIFNKGDATTIPKQFQYNVIDLQNVGTEEYGYLHFIIRKYHNLPDIIVFAQGDISDHKDACIPFASDDWMNRKKYVSFPAESHVSKMSCAEVIMELVKQVHLYGYSQNALAWNYYLDETYDAVPNLSFKRRIHGGPEQYVITFDKWFKEHVVDEMPEPHELYWFKNAMFGVHKRYIQSRPLTYWYKLLRQVESEPWHVCHFERSWFYIMNINAYHVELQSPFTWSSFMYHSERRWRINLWFDERKPYKLHKYVNLFTILQTRNEWNILDIGGNCDMACFVIGLRFSSFKFHFQNKDPKEEHHCMLLHNSKNFIRNNAQDLVYNFVHISGEDFFADKSLDDILNIVFRYWKLKDDCIVVIDGMYDDRVKTIVKGLCDSNVLIDVRNRYIFENYLGEMHQFIGKIHIT